MKEICLATHTDDINPGYIDKSTMASVRKQIRTAKYSTSRRNKEDISTKKYGMRCTVNRRARSNSRMQTILNMDEQVLLTLSSLDEKEQDRENNDSLNESGNKEKEIEIEVVENGEKINCEDKDTSGIVDGAVDKSLDTEYDKDS